MRLCGVRVRNVWALMVLCAMFSSTLASTAAANDAVKPFVIGGLAFGGETLVSTTGPDVDAGGFLYFGGGVLIDPRSSPLMYQFSVGYKVDSVEFLTDTGSGESSMSVLPLDAMVFLKVDSLRLGVGLTYYLDPEWEFCDDFDCFTVNFDDALGLALEFRHQWTDILFWGARYTSVDYEIGSISADANNLRIHMGMVF